VSLRSQSTRIFLPSRSLLVTQELGVSYGEEEEMINGRKGDDDGEVESEGEGGGEGSYQITSIMVEVCKILELC